MSLNEYKNEVREFLLRIGSLNGDNHQIRFNGLKLEYIKEIEIK